MTSDDTSIGDASNPEDAIIITQDDISNYNPSQILPLSATKIAEICKWLQPTEYHIPGGEYRRHLASHMPGTGRWLLSSEAYMQWLNSKDDGLLCIKGIPGSGKSVIGHRVEPKMHSIVLLFSPDYRRKSQPCHSIERLDGPDTRVLSASAGTVVRVFETAPRRRECSFKKHIKTLKNSLCKPTQQCILRG